MDVAWLSEHRLAETRAQEYDRFVDSAEGGHFAQTRAWSVVSRATGWGQSSYVLFSEGGELIATARVSRPTFVGVPLPVAKVERGPVLASPLRADEVLTELARQSRRRGIAQLQVMPYWSGDNAPAIEQALRAAKFRDNQHIAGSHVRTLRLALDASNEQFKGKQFSELRKELRRAERAEVTTRRTESTTEFSELNNQLLAYQGKKPRPQRWYLGLADFLHNHTDRGAMFIAEYQQRTIAAVLVIRHAAMATFVNGASTPDSIPVPKMMSALCQAVEWARSLGCTAFDMGGIPQATDDDPKRLQIAKFKYYFSNEPIDLVREHARWF